MDTEKIDLFVATHQKYFDPHQLQFVRDRLLSADDSRWLIVNSVEFKDPTILLIVSILAGQLGIDRFLLGQTSMGVLKLLTCGVCGVLTIIDWFQIQGATREYNMQQFLMAVG